MMAPPSSFTLETETFPASWSGQAGRADIQLPDWASEARAVGEQLLGYARRTADGTPFWLKHGLPTDSQGKPLPLGPHLYNGAAGVSFFLAALGHALDDQELRREALSSLAPVRRRLAALVADPRGSEQSQLRIGGAIGVGAFLYVLTRMSAWLSEPVLLAEACGIATLLTPERIAADRSFDIMYGSAGALLGLLALEKDAPEESRDEARLLERAVACGEHLLQQRVSRDSEPRAWPYNGGDPIPGFAHGASGAACALSRLAERTGREDFLAAAFEALAFEKHRYSPEQRNWRSSPERQESLMVAWCNGAPGVALGRLHLLGAPGCPGCLREELAIALETTAGAKEAGSDFPCCGNMGRAETLLQASRALGRPDLLERARAIAARVVARALGHWYGPGAEGANPAFFRGAAGIGYGFLRFAGFPLPSVLTLE
jgi:lantibiotic modifying enzyme